MIWNADCALRMGSFMSARLLGLPSGTSARIGRASRRSGGGFRSDSPDVSAPDDTPRSSQPARLHRGVRTPALSATELRTPRVATPCGVEPVLEPATSSFNRDLMSACRRRPVSASAFLDTVSRVIPENSPSYSGVILREENPRHFDDSHVHRSDDELLLAAGAMCATLLGHTQVQTTARYAHFANDPVKSAANRIASRIAEVAG